MAIKQTMRTCKSMVATFIVLLHINVFPVGTQVVNLRGKGASFPNEVYRSWIPAYKARRQAQVTLDMDYESIGSGAGKRAIMDNIDIEYAGSDSPLTENDIQNYPDLIEFPTMAGAIVIGYNIPSLNCQLRLTQEQLVGIYNGTYTYWNETTFVQSNPNCTVVNGKIVVIARADKSGSTSIFTAALSSFDTNWASVYGTFSAGRDSTTMQPVYWNPSAITYYGEQTRGVSGLMLSFHNSITYLSVADAVETNTNMAMLQNGEGTFTVATSESVQNAMEYFASRTTNITFRLANSLGDNAYPIASFTHFFMYKTGMNECSSAKELVRYVYWFLTDSSPINSCKSLGMTPLSPTLVSRIKDNVLKQITCDNGKNVWQLVEEENNAKDMSDDNSWVLAVSVSVPISFVIVFLLGGYILYQRRKYSNILNNNEWNIPIEDIIFYYDSRKTSSQKSRFVNESLKSLCDINESKETNILFQHVLQWPGKWNGNNIGLRVLEIKQFNTITLDMKKDMLWIRDKIIHQNVVRFYGLTEIENCRYVISDYCAKGSLNDILQDDKLNLNNDFKLSLTMDVALGMQFLHNQSIVHGNLRSSICLIDNKWTVRISDWEYIYLLTKKDSQGYPVFEMRKNDAGHFGNHAAGIRDFFVAPEILKSGLMCMPTKESDVYSFAMIMQEIYTREDPYSEHADTLTPKEIIDAVLNNNLRPQPLLDMPIRIRQILEITWTDNVASRPSFDQIIKMLKCYHPSRTSIIDSVLKSMEEYTDHLENRIEEKDSELIIATNKMEKAISCLLPDKFISCLSKTQKVENSKICNILGIISMEIDLNEESEQEISAVEQVCFMTRIYSIIDCLQDKYGFFKYCVTGNGCTLVLGLSDDEVSTEILGLHTAHLCLDLALECSGLKQNMLPTSMLKLKIGAHIGSAAVGVIDAVVPRFVIFGSLVDVANALARSANTDNIHITKYMWKVIKQTNIFASERAGLLTVKDISYSTFWLTGRTENFVKEVSNQSSADSGVGSEDHINQTITLENEIKTVKEFAKPMLLHKSFENKSKDLRKIKPFNMKQYNAKVNPAVLETQADIHP